MNDRRPPKQRVTIEMLRNNLVDEVGTPLEIYRWFLSRYRWLKRLGFINPAHGTLTMGPFRVVFRWNEFKDGSVMGMARVMGPEIKQSSRPKRLTDYPGFKMVVLNKHGKVCKIPLKNWDFKRKSRRVSQQ